MVSELYLSQGSKVPRREREGERDGERDGKINGMNFPPRWGQVNTFQHRKYYFLANNKD